MNVALLADFGSTFTKVLAVDLDAAVIAGHGLCPSGGDLMDSYDEAAGAALGQVRGPATVALELAASSAGGGLRMAAVGLVPELTALAAQTAALNAGARLLAVLAGRLTGADAARLARSPRRSCCSRAAPTTASSSGYWTTRRRSPGR